MEGGRLDSDAGISPTVATCDLSALSATSPVILSPSASLLFSFESPLLSQSLSLPSMCPLSTSCIRSCSGGSGDLFSASRFTSLLNSLNLFPFLPADEVRLFLGVVLQDRGVKDCLAYVAGISLQSAGDFSGLVPTNLS